MTTATDGKRDFLVSFTKPDLSWATWIAWVLEDAGYSVFFQPWDFKGNFVIEMDKAHKRSPRTVAVLSPDYLTSRFAAPEWTARFAQDATSEQDLLIPVRVRSCELEGLFAQIVYVDLVGCDDEGAARDKILKRVERIRLKPKGPPLFPGAVSHYAVPKRPAFPSVARLGVRAAGTDHVSPHTSRSESILGRARSIDVIRDRVFELMKRHDIDLPTMSEILDVPLSMLGREELLDRLGNPTLDLLASLFCVRREWLVGQVECAMQDEKRWYKAPVSLISHLLELERDGLQPELIFLKPVHMDADKTMREEGQGHRIGISVARTHKTPSGRTYRTFEPWKWEPWNYVHSRIDFLSIVMLFDRRGYKLFQDMNAAGTQNDDYDSARFDRIFCHAISVDDDAIAKYNNCQLILKELIDSRPTGSAWFPDEFTDRSMVRSKVKEPEIEFIEERYSEILKNLADTVRRAR